MSDVLSTLVAFVGVLIVLSSLVQSVQEALKNLLNLRSGVWERFFLALYSKELGIKPCDDGKSRRVQARSLWKVFRAGEFVGEFDKRMVRLKDAVVEGDKLLKSLKGTLTALKAIDPASPDLDKQVAELVGRVSDGVGKISALRLDSLLEIYETLTDGRIKVFYDALKEFEKKRSVDFTGKGAQALSEIPRYADDLLKSIAAVERAIGDYRLLIEQRLVAWLAQLSEEYRRNMLKWTVAIGAAVVVIFNADAFGIYRYLSTHDQAKAVVSRKGEGIVVPVQHAKSEEFARAETLIRQRKAGEAKGVLVALSQGMKEDFDSYGDPERAARAAALQKETEGVEAAGSNAQAHLKEKAGELAVLYVELQKLSVDYQVDTLASLDLPLGWVEDFKKIAMLCRSQEQRGTNSLVVFVARKAGGLTLTIFLITFGAPFWNDILGALAGIKNQAVKKGRSAELGRVNPESR